MLLSVFKNSVSRNAGEPNLRCLATPRVFLFDSLFREVVCEATFAKLVSRDTAFETFEKKNLRWHSHFYRTSGSFYSRIYWFTIWSQPRSFPHSLTHWPSHHSLTLFLSSYLLPPFPQSHTLPLSHTSSLTLPLPLSHSISPPLIISLILSIYFIQYGKWWNIDRYHFWHPLNLLYLQGHLT
jgi:hypothetical protein